METHRARKTFDHPDVLRQISAGTYDRQYAADELLERIEEYEAESPIAFDERQSGA